MTVAVVGQVAHDLAVVPKLPQPADAILATRGHVALDCWVIMDRVPEDEPLTATRIEELADTLAENRG
jgi:hypothetical protein